MNIKVLIVGLILFVLSTKVLADVDLTHYDHLDSEHLIPDDLLKKALAAYEAEQDSLKRKEVLTVIDFGKRSNHRRLYIVDMKSGAVEALHVAHGKGSDPDFDGLAQKFSNTPDSLMSSLGVYLTAETYSGEHGQSLRLDGLSATNSKARARAIVIHGANYVTDQNRVQGRSFGCPAVSQANIAKVISKIGGGSLIFAGISVSEEQSARAD